MATSLLSRALDEAAASRLVESGLPWTEAEFLAHQIGVQLAEFAQLLGISESTFMRRRRQRRFTADESDHLMRFARIWLLAVETFGNEEGARQWLRSDEIGLQGRQPLAVAHTEAGAREVETCLRRIDRGIPV